MLNISPSEVALITRGLFEDPGSSYRLQSSPKNQPWSLSDTFSDFPRINMGADFRSCYSSMSPNQLQSSQALTAAHCGGLIGDLTQTKSSPPDIIHILESSPSIDGTPFQIKGSPTSSKVSLTFNSPQLIDSCFAKSTPSPIDTIQDFMASTLAEGDDESGSFQVFLLPDESEAGVLPDYPFQNPMRTECTLASDAQDRSISGVELESASSPHKTNVSACKKKRRRSLVEDREPGLFFSRPHVGYRGQLRLECC